MVSSFNTKSTNCTNYTNFLDAVNTKETLSSQKYFDLFQSLELWKRFLQALTFFAASLCALRS